MSRTLYHWPLYNRWSLCFPLWFHND